MPRCMRGRRSAGQLKSSGAARPAADGAGPPPGDDSGRGVPLPTTLTRGRPGGPQPRTLQSGAATRPPSLLRSAPLLLSMRISRACLLWASLAAVLASSGASEGGADAPTGLVGARNLAAALDCSGVLGFSSVRHAPNASAEAPLAFLEDLSDRRGLGWSRHTGEFTCFCPGVYQIAFSGAGAQLSLRRRRSGGGSWTDVVQTGPTGGAHTLLLEMNVGDSASLWRLSGKLLPNTVSFSAFRLAKK